MSTNVPNLKQIGGGHRKNGQKFVDLMWNDPHATCATNSDELVNKANSGNGGLTMVV